MSKWADERPTGDSYNAICGHCGCIIVTTSPTKAESWLLWHWSKAELTDWPEGTQTAKRLTPA